jgi:hypothetical protein
MGERSVPPGFNAEDRRLVVVCRYQEQRAAIWHSEDREEDCRRERSIPFAFFCTDQDGPRGAFGGLRVVVGLDLA